MKLPAGAGSVFTKIRSRQMVVLGGVLAGVIALASVGGFLMAPSTPAGPVKEPPKTMPLATPVPDADQSAWRVSAEGEMTRLRTENAELAGKVSGFEQKSSEVEKQLKALEAKMAEQKPGSSAAPVPGGPIVPPPQPGALFGTVGTSAPPPQPAGRQAAVGTKPADPSSGVAPLVSIHHASVTDSSGALSSLGMTPASASFNGLPPKPGTSPDTKPGGAQEDSSTYLPTGSFIHATLLSGLDAPTGGQGQGDPVPMLLRLSDHAILPNGFRFDLNDCFATANAVGDLSSERAKVRMDRLSCIDDAGNALDVPIKGYVADEGGYTGIRGRLVTKTGQMIADALLAATVSGLGQGVAYSSTLTQTGPLGNITQTPQPGEGFKAGFGTGLGKGSDQIAAYFLGMAAKMFPVVEVDAGRGVDVILTHGVTLKRAGETATTARAD
jgi:conjugal transfer pilus assembly protein TraB